MIGIIWIASHCRVLVHASIFLGYALLIALLYVMLLLLVSTVQMFYISSYISSVMQILLLCSNSKYDSTYCINYAHFTLCDVLLWSDNGQYYLYPSGFVLWHCSSHEIVLMKMKHPWRTWVKRSSNIWQYNHNKTKHEKWQSIFYGIYFIPELIFLKM